MGVAHIGGVVYTGTHYGPPYGKIGTDMVGREEYSYFVDNIAIVGLTISHTVIAPEQVDGRGYTNRCSRWFWNRWINA